MQLRSDPVLACTADSQSSSPGLRCHALPFRQCAPACCRSPAACNLFQSALHPCRHRSALFVPPGHWPLHRCSVPAAACCPVLHTVSFRRSSGAAAPAAGRRSVHPAAAASSCCWSLLHSLRSVRRSHPPEKPRMPPCLQYRQWYWPRAALHAVLQAAHQSRQCTAALR